MQCAYVDAETGEKCVNTKTGHALGHQTSSGEFLKSGLFVETLFDAKRFANTVRGVLHTTMQAINAREPANRQEWRRHAADKQRIDLEKLRALGGYPRHDAIPSTEATGARSLVAAMRTILSPRDNSQTDLLNTSVCYGCLLGRPEYSLPCEHAICLTCVEDFDQTEGWARYPGVVTHKECIICSASAGKGWPYRTSVRPDLAGLRVLSLDGGGVRGIVELVLLQRLEKSIGIGLPLGQFFDLMFGTSAGKSRVSCSPRACHLSSDPHPGGIIALGLGIQRRKVDDCISLFRGICNNGFVAKTGTKSSLFGWAARWFRGSIYKTEHMETALQDAFASGRAEPNSVFGLANNSRVAVTTTADEKTYLIANYARGDSKRYINSKLPLWKA